MLAQRLGVDHFEALRRHALDHLRHVSELAAGEDVFVDEVADAAAEAVGAQRVVGDPVVQHEPPGLQNPPDLAEVPGKARDTHVLEHPDARDLVEERILGQVEVVAKLDLHAAFEPARGDLLARRSRTGSATA